MDANLPHYRWWKKSQTSNEDSAAFSESNSGSDGDGEFSIRADVGQSAHEIDITGLGISFDTMRIVLRFVYAKATILQAYQLQSVRSTAKFLGFKSLDRAIKRLQHAPAPPPKPVDTHSETTAPKTMSNMTSDNQTDEQDGVFKNRSFVRHNLD